MSPAKQNVHVVSHTHWDREWYQDFQGFRTRLVYMMDELIAHLENDPAYRYFMLDGQTIVLDDYLEIRPENRGRLEALIRAGRISIGPWYVMPDEFLVGGESLIRNLAKGMRDSRVWGVEPVKSGYVIDIFGHNSQMPQIFRGFGMDNAVFFRGFQGKEDTAEIWWEGADGSRVLGLKLDEDRCYSDFYFALRWPFFDRGQTYREHRKELVERAARLLAYKNARSSASVKLSLDGVDHVEIEPRLPEILEMLNQADGLNAAFSHSTLEAFLEELRRENLELPIYKGEQASTGYRGVNNWMPENTLSSRVHLKQMNQRCETLLEKWAEPLAVMSAWEGRPYPTAFLDKSWEHLLQNHPHDSICGCSIDQVHRDMVYRFDQSRLIAERMIKEQADYIVRHIGEESIGGMQALVVFNPSPSPADGILEADIELPAGSDAAVAWKGFNFHGTSFRLYDDDGNEIPYQVLSIEEKRASMHRPYGELPRYEPVDRFRVAFPGVIPAAGYRAYRVEPYPLDPRTDLTYSAENLVAPMRYPGTMRTSDHSWSNGRIRVAVQSNGTLDVTNLETGYRHEGLLMFEDEADAGDGWSHVSPANNERVTSLGARTAVSTVFDGPYQTRIKIRMTLDVPRGLKPDENSRSDELESLEVTTFLDLKKDDPTVYCRTRIRNTARDHRLRLLLPSVPDAESYCASTPFDLVTRAIRKRDYSDYVRKPLEVAPYNGLIAVDKGEHGLAVFTKGLYEADVRDNEGRTIALTLLRSTGKEVMTDGGDGGQLLGDIEFEYAIRPYRPGACDKAWLWKERERYVSGIRAVNRKAGRFPETPHVRTADLPGAKSYLELQSEAFVLSAFKAAEAGGDACVIRLVNLTEREGVATLVLARDVARAELVDLNENPVSVIPADKNSIRLTGGAKKIVTIKVTFA